MTEKQRLALIQLCGKHVFSDSKIAEAKSPNFVTCENCPLEFGEIEQLGKKFPLYISTTK